MTDAKHQRRAYVGRDGLGEYFGYVTDHETHTHILEQGEWTDLEEALAWARERADRVVLTYGSTHDGVFSAGAVYWPGDYPEPLPPWPPAESVRARIEAEARREAEATSLNADRLGVSRPEIVKGPED